MKKELLYLFILLTLSSCTKKNNTNIAFYHWKSKAKMNTSLKKALTYSKSNTVYLHYFDLKLLNKNDWKNDGIYPIYLVRDVDKEFKNYNIVPVIYVTNKVFKNKIDIYGLANRTIKLIHQISNKQFGREFKTIQVDCDWTQNTKTVYFKYLSILATEFEVNATIRLHQIKYKNKTGIPPVNKGTLMLYNVGDLKNKTQNSILENSIVKQYINAETDYPLILNLGLPLFSQTVVTNTDNKIKIIKNTERAILENDKHFKKIDANNFTIVRDTLYKGFYLSENYNLKLEELSENEIINSYKTIKNSKLKIDQTIFYHLDSIALNNINLEKIITKL